MRALPELQKGIRDALVLGEISGLESVLVGGRDARKRLAIHQRHYRTSLITALLDRFPATGWLVGSEFVTDAAREFVRAYPPSRPCIAEYGDEFPTFLGSRTEAQAIPYLRQFSELEWHVGRLSIAVDLPARTIGDVARFDAMALGDAGLVLQPGVHYFHGDWAVDELISLYLSDSAPDRFALTPGDVWLEVRGARGELRMTRLSQTVFAFRRALASGVSLADAAISAFDIDSAFDAGQALIGLVDDGLVAAIRSQQANGAQ